MASSELKVVAVHNRQITNKHRFIGFALIGLVVYILSNIVDEWRAYQGATVAVFVVAIASIILLTGYSGQISLGHGALLAVGAYTAALTQIYFSAPIWICFAAAVLVTPSIVLADAVEKELLRQIKLTKHSERITTALSGIQSAIAIVDDIAQGIDVVNAYAAEHLEIQTKDAQADSAKIRNAGAVFIGNFTPVSLGDYSAGSNHVLPTGGCACHSSGLSVATFLRGLHFIEYSESAFRDIAPTVITLAQAEDLPAHGQAMSARLEDR